MKYLSRRPYQTTSHNPRQCFFTNTGPIADTKCCRKNNGLVHRLCVSVRWDYSTVRGLSRVEVEDLGTFRLMCGRPSSSSTLWVVCLEHARLTWSWSSNDIVNLLHLRTNQLWHAAIYIIREILKLPSKVFWGICSLVICHCNWYGTTSK